MGGALHQRFFTMAVTGSSVGSKSGGKYARGTKEKVTATDTWCDHHELYFPVEHGHKSSTCYAKTAAAKKAAKAKS